MIVPVFNIKRKFSEVYTTEFIIQGLQLRAISVILLSSFFIGTSISYSQDTPQLKQQTNLEKKCSKRP